MTDASQLVRDKVEARRDATIAFLQDLNRLSREGEAAVQKRVADTLERLGCKVERLRYRPSDVPISACNNQHLVAATGWQPQIDLRTSLTDLLNYWRKRLQNQK